MFIMRSLALVCAILLALAGMAAGAMAEDVAPEAEAPAPEVSAPVARAEESDARETSQAADASNSDLLQVVAHETAEYKTSVEDIAVQAEEPEARSEEPDEPVETWDAVDLSAPEAVEAVEDAPKSDAVEADAPEADAPEQTQDIQTALSFNGWDYSDVWDVPGEVDNTGIVSVLEHTSINTRPGRNSSKMTWAGRGTELEYLNVTEYDSDGVAWYQIYWDGWTGWVSSRSTRLWWPTYY